MANDFSRKRVLVVDDFQNMRSTLKKMLQVIGVNDIDLASNGEEAVRLLGRQNYDIVLCDYNLGEGRDGQQVLEEAKHRRLIGYDTVFVMITAENTMEMVMGAIEYRPDDYLTKPFNKDLLRSRLEKLIDRKRDLGPIEKAAERKDYATAIALCDERIAAGARNVGELLRTKVDLSLAASEYELAEATCREVLDKRAIPWAQLALGKVFLATGRAGEAERQFRELVAQHVTFMEAHDCLAKALLRQGRDSEAQAVLGEAARLSPKSVLRQQALGDVASRNEDYTVAERAFRKAVGLGRDSVYRSAEPYTSLARVQARNGSGLDAVRTLASLRKEFTGEPQAALQAALAEGEVYGTLGRAGDAQGAFDQAKATLAKLDGPLPPKLAIALAKGYMQFGEDAAGVALMQDVVRNNHESEELLDQARRAFVDLGRAEEGQRVIADTRGEVVRLNNDGVSLFKQGKADEAARLFEAAAARMPANRTVNLNAAQVLLFRVQKGGDPAQLATATEYLERVRRLAPADPMLRKLDRIRRELTGSQAGE